MYPRNSATPQRIAIGAVVQINDGAIQSTGVAVNITAQGGSATAGAGTIAYSAAGTVLYTPTQAETNVSTFIVEASKAGCYPVAVTIVTTASATVGTVLLAPVTHTSAVIPTVSTLTGHTPQTGDAFARLGAPAGVSVSADVAAVKVDTASAVTRTTDIQARLPAALVSGRIDASVGAMAANTVNASALATDAVTEIQSGLATSAALATAQGVLSKLDTTVELDGGVYRFTTNALEQAPAGGGGGGGLDAAGVRAAIGLASANLDTQLADIPTVAEFNARSIASSSYATAAALATAQGVLTKLDTTMQLDGSVYRFTANALEQAPAGGGGASGGASVAAIFGADTSGYPAGSAGAALERIHEVFGTGPLAPTPTPPPDVWACRLYGFMETVDNQVPQNVSIQIVLVSPGAVQSDSLIYGRTVTITAGGEGQITDGTNDYVELQRNDAPGMQGTYYLISSEGLGLAQPRQVILNSPTKDINVLLAN
jgi:hypothetical protein